ncbi:MAG: germination protein Ger(x)C family [Anaerosporomusa subterranea]|jgi:spore germination protein KC|nr:germination protein Ger(x)C family [Anaerosporomusa subterranea]
MLKFLFFHKSSILISLLLVCCLLTAGCWDRREIETRGFVLGMAIDMAQSEPEDKPDILKAAQSAGTRKYKTSFEMKKFRSKSGGGDKPGTGEDESLVYAAEGESLFSIVRAVNTQYPAGLFFEDNQLLVFSEAVARDGIEDITDFLDRDPEFRRRARVFVTPGRAEELFTCKTKSGELISTYIPRITRNEKKSPTFATMIEVGLISKKILNNQSFSVPLILAESDNVKAIGTALFNREFKMVGTLSELETVGTKILHRKLSQGITVTPNPANPDKIAVFELFESNIKVEPYLEQGELWFELEAKFIGSLAENQVAKQNPHESGFLTALEESLAEEFSRQARIAYTKLQENKTDVVELGFLVHKKYPEYWKTVKKRWDEELFPTVPLKDVKIKVVIRSTSMTL